jgi:hypothetical protein
MFFAKWRRPGQASQLLNACAESLQKLSPFTDNASAMKTKVNTDIIDQIAIFSRP